MKLDLLNHLESIYCNNVLRLFIEIFLTVENIIMHKIVNDYHDFKRTSQIIVISSPFPITNHSATISEEFPAVYLETGNNCYSKQYQLFFVIVHLFTFVFHKPPFMLAAQTSHNICFRVIVSLQGFSRKPFR